MMTSETVSAVVQADGRISVQQHHILASGAVVDVFVLADAGTDLDALLRVYAAQLAEA
jgi:hypothetical protein